MTPGESQFDDGGFTSRASVRSMVLSAVLVVVSAVVAVVLAGCASDGLPKAWEKGNLAKPEMTFGHDTLEQRNAAHVYASKENASGGAGVGGGGCGCN